MGILRYDKTYVIGTDLDPIEDILNFMTTLKSKGFTSDLLRNTHSFSSASEINQTTKSIGHHIDNALGLAKQAFDGPPETSFLPLYYSSLNLIKVYLLILKKRTALAGNRWHGAKYLEDGMGRQLLNERIKIMDRGTIPLIYETITGKRIGRDGIEVRLEELYGSISSISAEYTTITGNKCKLMWVNAYVIQDDANGHYLKVEVIDNHYSDSPPKPRQLKAFSGLTLIQNPNENPYYQSARIRGNFTMVHPRILRSIKRHLLCDHAQQSMLNQNWYTSTPVNGRHHVFNEDLCILLAYFHLSNVVRYNPEHLFRLMDSKHWAILLGIRKHGYLRFLKLMWGNYTKTSFDVA